MLIVKHCGAVTTITYVLDKRLVLIVTIVGSNSAYCKTCLINCCSKVIVGIAYKYHHIKCEAIACAINMNCFLRAIKSYIITVIIKGYRVRSTDLDDVNCPRKNLRRCQIWVWGSVHSINDSFPLQSHSPVSIEDVFGVQPNKVLDLIRAMIGHCQCCFGVQKNGCRQRNMVFLVPPEKAQWNTQLRLVHVLTTWRHLWPTYGKMESTQDSSLHYIYAFYLL